MENQSKEPKAERSKSEGSKSDALLEALERPILLRSSGSGIPIDSKRTRKINSKKCPDCREHPYSNALVPCGHLFCDLCILEYQNGQKCPICRTFISGKL